MPFEDVAGASERGANGAIGGVAGDPEPGAGRTGGTTGTGEATPRQPIWLDLPFSVACLDIYELWPRAAAR